MRDAKGGCMNAKHLRRSKQCRNIRSCRAHCAKWSADLAKKSSRYLRAKLCVIPPVLRCMWSRIAPLYKAL